MIRELMITSAVLATGLASVASAQTNMKIVREAIPEQRSVIIANSAEDIALREEIRKIRAYNAYVNSQVGVSAAENVYEAVPATPKTNVKIELFETPAPISSIISTSGTHISYVSSEGAVREVIPVTTITRHSLSGEHRILEGETLYGLARANCITVVDIQKQNDMRDTHIQLGQMLKMPSNQCVVETIAVSTETAEVKAPVTQVTRQSEAQTEHVRKVMPVPTGVNVADTHNYAVLPKDTLYSIGRQYCLKAVDLAAHNGIVTGAAIQPGQILRVPPTACVK